MARLRHRDPGGRFGSATRTGDGDNVVIFAAAVCLDEMAQD